MEKWVNFKASFSKTNRFALRILGVWQSLDIPVTNYIEAEYQGKGVNSMKYPMNTDLPINKSNLNKNETLRFKIILS